MMFFVSHSNVRENIEHNNMAAWGKGDTYKTHFQLIEFRTYFADGSLSAADVWSSTSTKSPRRSVNELAELSPL